MTKMFFVLLVPIKKMTKDTCLDLYLRQLFIVFL